MPRIALIALIFSTIACSTTPQSKSSPLNQNPTFASLDVVTQKSACHPGLTVEQLTSDEHVMRFALTANCRAFDVDEITVYFSDLTADIFVTELMPGLEPVEDGLGVGSQLLMLDGYTKMVWSNRNGNLAQITIPANQTRIFSIHAFRRDGSPEDKVTFSNLWVTEAPARVIAFKG